MNFVYLVVLVNIKKPNEEKGNRTCNITTKVKKQDIKYIIRSDKFPLEQYK